jgi:hypothetical protein
MASTIAPELMGGALARQNITCSLLRWHKLTLTPLLLRLRLTSDNPDGARSYSRVGRLLVGPPARTRPKAPAKTATQLHACSLARAFVPCAAKSASIGSAMTKNSAPPAERIAFTGAPLGSIR